MKRAHDENVPSKLTEEKFWTLFIEGFLLTPRAAAKGHTTALSVNELALVGLDRDSTDSAAAYAAAQAAPLGDADNPLASWQASDAAAAASDDRTERLRQEMLAVLLNKHSRTVIDAVLRSVADCCGICTHPCSRTYEARMRTRRRSKRTRPAGLEVSVPVPGRTSCGR